MYPGTHAAEAPDRIAAVMTGTGETLSYGQLEQRSVQLARVLHDAGLRPGDVVALLTENSLRAFEVYWAALRSGLYVTAVNYHLKPDEVAYIVNDSVAAALIVSAEQTATAEAIIDQTAAVKLRLAFGGPVSGYDSYERTIAAAPAVPLADQPHGATMLYSSGTTGRPKGVRPALPGHQIDEPGYALVGRPRSSSASAPDTVYLSPGAALSRRAAALVRCDPGLRRHGGDDGAVRRRAGAARYRAVPASPTASGCPPCSFGC